MKILITGAAGFVGKHLLEYLKRDQDNNILAVDISFKNLNSNDSFKDVDLYEADLTDKESVFGIVKKFKPQHVYHLAAQSSVSYSWGNPVETFRINVFGGINVLESLRLFCPKCRILVVCTAEEYGEINGGGKAIDENFKIYPQNPYSISKSALDFFSSVYHNAYRLPVLISRSFNHIGPRQSQRFVCSDFARQIAMIEKGLQKPVINVGNLKAQRDFLDVRDAVSAYHCIMNKGKEGQIYNVCSGKKYKISDLLDILISLSTVPEIRINIDRGKFRAIDIEIIYGNNSKLKAHTGWKPVYSINRSLNDTINCWRENITIRAQSRGESRLN